MRAVVVFNPRSGRGDREIPRAVRQSLVRAGWRVDLASVADTASLAALAAAATTGACDAVIAVGGDGTVGRVAAALVGSGVPLGIVPAGTGNLLVRNLGIPHAPVAASRVIAAGHRRTIDLGSVSDAVGDPRRWFAVACGVGFDAAVMVRTRPSLKRRWGRLAYVATGLALSGRIISATCRVTIDGVPREFEAAEVFVANCGQLWRGVRPRPPIRPDDGLLDVIVVRASARSHALLAAAEALSGPAYPPGLGARVFRALASEVQVAADPALPTEVDGDPIGITPLTVRVAPAALSVFVPRP